MWREIASATDGLRAMVKAVTPTTTDGFTYAAALPWIVLGVVYVVWGSTYLGIRFLIESAPALLSGGARFLCTGLLLAAIVTVVAGPGVLRSTRSQLGTAVLVGLLLPAWGQGLVMIAEHHVASGLTAVLVACMPLYVVLLRRVLGERPHRVTMLWSAGSCWWSSACWSGKGGTLPPPRRLPGSPGVIW